MSSPWMIARSGLGWSSKSWLLRTQIWTSSWNLQRYSEYRPCPVIKCISLRDNWNIDPLNWRSTSAPLLEFAHSSCHLLRTIWLTFLLVLARSSSTHSSRSGWYRVRGSPYCDVEMKQHYSDDDTEIVLKARAAPVSLKKISIDAIYLLFQFIRYVLV